MTKGTLPMILANSEQGGNSAEIRDKEGKLQQKVLRLKAIKNE